VEERIILHDELMVVYSELQVDVMLKVAIGGGDGAVT
jgi:hypothetical protein